MFWLWLYLGGFLAVCIAPLFLRLLRPPEPRRHRPPPMADNESLRRGRGS